LYLRYTVAMTHQQLDIQSLVSGVTRKYRSVLIFGPPGSGKGTLGKFLSSAGSHCHLSSGEIFRGMSPESPAGKLYQTYAAKGNLLPEDVAVGIWHHYVKGLIATNRYLPHQQLLLLDGIPRTLYQTQLLENHIQIMHIIALESNDTESLIGRMKRRALIERRADDLDESFIRRRIEIYKEETLQLLTHYPSDLISYFNVDQRPLEVLRDVLTKLSDLLSHSEESYL
jgi:adenylate kinase